MENTTDFTGFVADSTDGPADEANGLNWHLPAFAGAIVLLGPTAILLGAGYAIAKVMDK